MQQKIQSLFITNPTRTISYIGTGSREEQGVRAIKEIPLGTLLVHEAPFTSFLRFQKLHTHCSGCWKCPESLAKLQRCGRCKVVRYCGKGCQTRDWKNQHSKECTRMKAAVDTHPLGMEGLLSVPNTAQLLFMGCRVICQNKMTQASSLIHHFNDLKPDQRDLMVRMGSLLGRITLSLYDPVPENWNKKCTELLCRLQCNGFNIPDDELHVVGAAVFIQASHFNHSCQPNAAASFSYNTDRGATIRNIRPLKPGEEVLISYTDRLQTCEQRANDLWMPFFFRCSCPLCCSPEKEIYDKKVTVFHKKANFLVDEIDKEIMRNNIPKVIAMHKQKLALTRELLPEYSSEVGHCCDAIGSWYDEIRKEEEAREYLLRAQEILRVTESESATVLNLVKARLLRLQFERALP